MRLRPISEKQIEMLRTLKTKNFFSQMKGVDLDGNTSPKLYSGDAIYMNGICVKLNASEVDAFNKLLSEAVIYFANESDDLLRGIKNYTVIGVMYKPCGIDKYNVDCPGSTVQWHLFQQIL